jgi:hypothetical protein
MKKYEIRIADKYNEKRENCNVPSKSNVIFIPFSVYIKLNEINKKTNKSLKKIIRNKIVK